MLLVWDEEGTRLRLVSGKDRCGDKTVVLHGP